MEQILCLEVDMMGIMILMIMLFNIRKIEYSEETPDQKLFGLMLLTNIGILIFDVGMWLLDEKQFYLARELNQVDTILYFILNPLACFLWLLYTEYKIYQDKLRIVEKVSFYSIPFILNAAIVMVSPITGWIFYIDAQNHYSRGSIFWLMPILSFTYVFYASYLTIKGVRHNKDIDKTKIYRCMIEFPFLPLVGSIIQSLFFGMPLIWNFTAISLLIIFINIQNKTIMTDKLTDLYNRRYMEEYLAWKIQTMSKDDLLFAILIDVDRFKQINDRYGHLAGDQALRDVADILRGGRNKYKDLLVRLGGDEFMVIGERRSDQEVEETIADIQKCVKVFNSSKEQMRDYCISLSIGYAIWGSEGIHTIDGLIAAADKRMYVCKVLNHQ